MRPSCLPGPAHRGYRDSVSEVADEIAELEAAVVRAEGGLRGRPPRTLLDEALTRYLAAAVSSGRVVLAAARAGASNGVGPNLRHLFETLVDLHFLVTEADPGEAAARSLAWDALEWERHSQLDVEVLAAMGLPQPPRKSAAAAIAANCASLRERGDEASAAHVEREYEALASRPLPRHWSGLSRAAMIDEIEQRDAGLRALYRSQFAWESYNTHASPRWMRPTTGGDDSEALRVRRARMLLGRIRSLIGAYEAGLVAGKAAT